LGYKKRIVIYCLSEYHGSRFVSTFRRLVTGLLLQRIWFKSRLGRVRTVVQKVALREVFLPVLQCYLSVSFNQWPSFIFIYVLLLREGQMTEACSTSAKESFFKKSGIVGYNLTTGLINNQRSFVRSTVHSGHKYVLHLIGHTAWSNIKKPFQMNQPTRCSNFSSLLLVV
jgi:hypothetical protein